MDNVICATRTYVTYQYPHYASYVADATAVLLCVASGDTDIIVPAEHDLTKLVCIALPGVQWRGMFDISACTQTELHMVLHADRDSSMHIEFFLNGNMTNTYALTVVPLGAGSSTHVVVRYAVRDDHKISMYTRQTHDVPNCSSSVDVKGIVCEAASVDVRGRIVVTTNGKHTVAQFLHKALLVSSDARACGKPELEVHTPDVSCKHGNAVGRVDEQQLLYAQARGYTEPDARKLLIHAFLQEGCSKKLLFMFGAEYADNVRL